MRFDTEKIYRDEPAGGGKQRLVNLPTDHGFNDCKYGLAEAVLNYFSEI